MPKLDQPFSSLCRMIPFELNDVIRRLSDNLTENTKHFMESRGLSRESLSHNTGLFFSKIYPTKNRRIAYSWKASSTKKMAIVERIESSPSKIETCTHLGTVYLVGISIWVTREKGFLRFRQELLSNVTHDSGWLDPQVWLAESRVAATQSVYTQNILVDLKQSIGSERGDPIDLDGGYLKNAGRIAQRRALQASHRLAAQWRTSLNALSK